MTGTRTSQTATSDSASAVVVRPAPRNAPREISKTPRNTNITDATRRYVDAYAMVSPASGDPGGRNTSTTGAGNAAVSSVSGIITAVTTPSAARTARHARSGFSAPRFCPTTVLTACASPIAGRNTSEMRRLPRPYAATTAGGNVATNAVSTTNASDTPDCSSAEGTPSFTTSRTMSRSGTRSPGRTVGPAGVPNSTYQPTTVATAREISVAHAAPSIPSAGNGPHPKMRNGSSTTFTATETTITRSGARVSP